MPAVRDILKHVSVEPAARQRKCHRCGAKVIKAGEACLVVKEEQGTSNYCREHAAEILDKAAVQFSSIRAALHGGPATS